MGLDGAAGVTATGSHNARSARDDHDRDRDRTTEPFDDGPGVCSPSGQLGAR
jgi:hypothetical protein